MENNNLNKKDLQSLLREAASIPVVNVPPIQISKREEDLIKATEIVEAGPVDKWSKIIESMEGEFADRFLEEMRALSGREFVRVYGKMLEYVKPKIVRVENKVIEQEDRILRIEVYNSTNQLNIPQEPIDITPKDEE